MPDPIRIIIGASSQDYPGWIKTQQSDLDVTQRTDWMIFSAPCGVAALLAEHVWEHLSPEDAARAAQLCFEFLAPGRYIRCAVPDGLFPDLDYQNIVQVGGPGPANHPAASHRVLYDYRSLSAVFRVCGFDLLLLEWWSEHGRFNTIPWDEHDGYVYRSARFDHRNQHGKLGFTSLILDAIKPE